MQNVCGNKQNITDTLQMLGIFEKSVSPYEWDVSKVHYSREFSLGIVSSNWLVAEEERRVN